MEKSRSRGHSVAVIGYAVRLPGARDRDAFWKLMAERRCAVTRVPSERFPTDAYYHPKAGADVPGRSYSFSAGLIDNVWDFDPAAFGISPREAMQVDPQQRHLLEVTYEAVEHAGLRPSRLAGSETGVYVGASSSDHATRFMFDPAAVDMHMMTGNTLSLISNRLSYCFDLHGPSFTVDTACSSSLVAMHLAVEAIRAGKIDTAIVGGVNMLLAPFSFLGFSRASMLSPSGLCKAFDASGDGYVRAEGAVALVLRAEDAARRNGDRVHATVVGSGTNQDGRTTGLSLPSSEAQAALLNSVYESCGVSPQDLAFVEAHGTGTRVGDPAEAEALGTVLGQRRSTPLPIGSVKTNIGHLEPASGLAGVVKSIMALERGELPASLHFNDPNPDIRFDALNIRVADTAVPLPKRKKARYAGVNSFGFGGSNAHVVLREGEKAAPAGTARENAPLILSAHGAAPLASLGERYAARLSDGLDADAVVNAAAHHRDLLSERLVIAGTDVRETLSAYLEGKTSTGAWSGTALGSNLDAAFVFSGNGSQWAGMGLGAYAANRAFRAALDDFDAQFKPTAGWSIVEMLQSPDLSIEIRRASYAQPLLFALQVATVQALAAHGLQPAIAIGHSVGEIGAAWCAGALDLQSAIRVVLSRSRRQEMTRHVGGMAAVLISAAEMRSLLDHGSFPGLEIAAVNSARSITVAGPKAVIDALAAFAEQERWRARILDLDYPFHCALVDPIERQLLDDLDGLAPFAANIPFVSTVEGRELPGETLDAGYWWRNVRAPVNFEGGMAAVCERGIRVFVEIGPHQVLGGYLHDALRAHGLQGAVVGTLGRDAERGHDEILGAASRALVAGGRIDLDRFAGPPMRPAVSLPNYAWDRRRFQVEATGEAMQTFAAAPHPLLGRAMRAGSPEWIASIDPNVMPWLGDHRVDEAAVFPAAGFVEVALAAARETFGDGPIEIRDLEILQPLVFDGLRSVEIVSRLSPESGNVEMRSRVRPGTEEGALNAKAKIGKAPVACADAPPMPGNMRERIDMDALYAITQRRGFAYGPAFQRVERMEVADDRTALVVFTATTPASDRFILDPTILDAAFHVVIGMIERDPAIARDAFLLPVRAGSLRVYRPGVPVREGLVRITSSTTRSLAADFVLLDADGAVVAELSQARCRIVARDVKDNLDDLIYRKDFVRLHDHAAVSALPLACADGPGRGLSDAAHAIGDRSEISDAALVLDAGARAAALAAVKTIAGDDDSFLLSALVSEGRLASSAWPLMSQMLLALSDAGLASESEERWSLSKDSDLPDVRELVDVLLTRYPAMIAEATVLARLPDSLASILANGFPPKSEIGAAVLDHLERGSPAIAQRVAILGSAAAAIFERWPKAQPLRILIIGAANAPLAVRLSVAVAACNGTVTVTDLRDERLETLRLSPFDDRRLRMVPWAVALEAQYDLILCANVLHEIAAAPGRFDLLTQAMCAEGALLAVEPAPSLFADLVYGQTSSWWSRSLDSDFPMGAMMTGRDWSALLSESGWQNPLVQASDGDLLMSARAPRKPATSAMDAGSHGVVIVADAESRAFADLLSPRLANVARVVPFHASEGRAHRRIRIASMKEVRQSGIGDDQPAATDVVFLANARDASADPVETLAQQSMAVIQLAKSVGQRDGIRLWVVTSGAFSGLVDDQSAHPSQTGLAAMLRVLRNEYPQIGVHCLDLDPGMAADAAARRVAEAIVHPSDEPELRLEQHGQSALRLSRGNVLHDAAGHDLAGHGARRLEFRRSGQFDSFTWSGAVLPAVGADDIRIAVQATGLNFRDVMWSLGLLPDEALENGFTGPAIGMECAGTVAAVGANVKHLRVGDRVVAFAANAFASEVVVDARMAAPIPDEIATEAAATLPVAFLTAYYALIHLARLEAGVTVLIHGGAGGVGLAALQIAKARGAIVIATAGTPDRRALLRNLGVDHVFDSRSLSFADDIRRLCGGVDVVLNSLAGEAMTRSIDCLKPFGRFLELGKRDYYQNTQIGLRPFRNNLSYFGIDADQLLRDNEVLIGKLFAELMAMFASGELVPLPYRIFDAEETASAFRLMQRSGHIGKILVRPPRVESATKKASGFKIDPKGCYLVVGGVGGFGLATAQWLVRHGARHLALISRSGKIADDARPFIDAMKADGVAVDIAAVDATDKAALDRYLKIFDGAAPTLKGVFHAAMVLDDALAADLTRQRVEAVLAPKVAGATHLDQLTRRFDLDCFVLFSSVSAMIGNIGQANYVAANAFLEGLARRRRSEGLPALAVGFGAIGDAGYLARNAAVGQALSQRFGKSTLTAAEALEGLGALLQTDSHEIAGAAIDLARMDWALARKELAFARSPMFETLDLDDAAGEGASLVADELLSQLRDLSDDEVQAKLAELISASIARTLRLPSGEIDRNRALSDFGMDSLMMLELRMAVEEQMGIDIPLMSLTASLTINDIGKRLTAMLRNQDKAVMSGQMSALAQEHVSIPDTVSEDDMATTVAAVTRRARTVDRIL